MLGLHPHECGDRHLFPICVVHVFQFSIHPWRYRIICFIAFAKFVSLLKPETYSSSWLSGSCFIFSADFIRAGIALTILSTIVTEATWAVRDRGFRSMAMTLFPSCRSA